MSALPCAMRAVDQLIAELKTWLREQRTKLSAKNETAKAIDYSLKRWTALTRFLDDGRLCISNNAAERALRGIVVGRHNTGRSPAPTKVASRFWTEGACVLEHRKRSSDHTALTA
jgi:hypothetical protein